METTSPRLQRSSCPFLLAASLGGCAIADDAPGDLGGFEDWVDGKYDTGYGGNRAAEIEAVVTGRVRVPLPDKTQEELEAIAATLRADPRSWDVRDVAGEGASQVKD